MSIALPNTSYFDHPSEESLERFLLHHSAQDERDRLETHILGCDDCVLLLEDLEIQIAATKLALQPLARKLLRAEWDERFSFRDCFTFRSLSWAGAAAVFSLALAVAPRLPTHPRPAVEVTLSANRGLGVATVPLGKNLRLVFNAPGVANGPVHVTVVDGVGTSVWQGTAKVRDEQVRVTLPKFENSGSHFLRLYAPTSGTAENDLLREFPFEVKK